MWWPLASSGEDFLFSGTDPNVGVGAFEPGLAEVIGLDGMEDARPISEARRLTRLDLYHGTLPSSRSSALGIGPLRSPGRLEITGTAFSARKLLRLSQLPDHDLSFSFPFGVSGVCCGDGAT